MGKRLCSSYCSWNIRILIYDDYLNYQIADGKTEKTAQNPESKAGVVEKEQKTLM